EYNARALAALGAAEVLVQQDLHPELLSTLIKKYSAQGRSASAVTRMENRAAEEIVRICKDYVQKN
ncbi:MAG TPA: undecaprenyldiphospho-muramoylpentapeptide beta-N-acetylglucosaminyltransferase, partial [Nitrospirota bacterium]